MSSPVFKPLGAVTLAFFLALPASALPGCRSVGAGPYVGRGEFDSLSRRVDKLEYQAGTAAPERTVLSTPRDRREKASGVPEARRANPIDASGLGQSQPAGPVPPPSQAGLLPPAGVKAGTSAAGSSKAAGTPKAAAPASAAKSDQAVYQQGQSLLKQKKYDQAAEVFRGLLSRNPSGPLAPNARYWLGECHYAKGEYRRAAAEFQRCAGDYPASAKAPDALLKLSYSFDRLGDGPQAMNALDQLLSRYPDSEAAELMKSGRGGFKS